MDEARFDTLARILGAGPAPRRAALRLLAGGALSALAAGLGVGRTASQSACSAPAQPCPGCCAGLDCGADDRCCIPTRSAKKCRKGSHCCSGVCKKKRGKPTGTCACRPAGQGCTAGRNCCSGRCGANGKCLDA